MDSSHLSLRQCLAQKLMVDLRFFNDAPVTQLPAELAAELKRLQPGGVILFRENIVDPAQTLHLVAAIRRACDGVAGPPLLGIDQEGGRVVRLDRRWAVAFNGLMPLGACPAGEGEELARAMGAAQARQLAALGIDINFSPCLDVNSNPHNPVINVRAFGDQPSRVGALGAALCQGLQAGGVAAAVKHFPGHGDTSVDSHSGLPRVERSLAQTRALDLAPFVQVFAAAAPALVMTAHIQCPALDDSLITDEDGAPVERPATLSRAIMHDLLREELGYAGVSISDALDMGAIADLFSPSRAVLECFAAGVDIALMPLRVRRAADFAALQGILDDVEAAVAEGRLDERELRASVDRILGLKQRYCHASRGPVTQEQIDSAQAVFADPAAQALQRRIAECSVTRLHGDTDIVLQAGDRVHVLMPVQAEAEAMATALQGVAPGLTVSAAGALGCDPAQQELLAREADLLVLGNVDPAPSPVVAGGAEDPREAAADWRALQTRLLSAAGPRRVVVMLGMPHHAVAYRDQCEVIYATYDSAPRGYGDAPGPAFEALARVLCGQLPVRGMLPVSS